MSDQNRCRYRSHSAGNRCYGVYNRLYCREIHVTAQFPFRVHIDADIDDGLAFPDIIRADHACASCRDNDQVRVSGDRGHMIRSASLVTAGISLVLVWQIVTVAFFLISIIAAGLPTTRLLPMTTAFLPVQS